VMKLCRNNSEISTEVVFPPTGSWTTLGTASLGNASITNQISLTTRDGIGPRFGAISFRWTLNCSGTQGCGWSSPITGACPTEPLPGVPASGPVAPVARVTATPSQGQAPLAVTFDGSQSTDRNFDPLSFYWDFNDGATASGQSIVDHVFATGIYYVTLEVSDPTGLSDRKVTQINAPLTNPGNTQPQAVITAPRTNLILPHGSVTLDASRSTDADGDPLDYVWYDATNERVQRSTTFDLTFTEPTVNTNLVYLGVSDGRGGINNTMTQFSVQNPPEHECVLRYTESYPLFRTFVTLYNNTATPVQNWQAGFQFDAAVQINQTNGVLVSGSNPYTFRGPATATHIPAYSWIVFWFDVQSTAVLQDIAITPLNGLVCQDNRPPRVNHAPVPALSVTPQTGNNPLTVQFSASGSIDPDGDSLSYRWYFGDGAQAVGITASHTYTSGGTFGGYLEVSDGTLKREAQFNVTVAGDPGVSCQTSISRGADGDFTAYLIIQNKRTTAAVNGISGTLSMSAPVSITGTDGTVNINPVSNTLNVPFTVSQSIAAGEVFYAQFHGTYTDSNMYMTNCTANSR
jgi:PKD repeat protein